jgi:hypothetical protein
MNVPVAGIFGGLSLHPLAADAMARAQEDFGQCKTPTLNKLN